MGPIISIVLDARLEASLCTKTLRKTRLTVRVSRRASQSGSPSDGQGTGGSRRFRMREHVSFKTVRCGFGHDPATCLAENDPMKPREWQTP